MARPQFEPAISNLRVEFADHWITGAICTCTNIFQKELFRKVKDVVDSDRRLTTLYYTGGKKRTVLRILKRELGISKVCARWIPWLLSDENKTTRVKASNSFLFEVETL